MKCHLAVGDVDESALVAGDVMGPSPYFDQEGRHFQTVDMLGGLPATGFHRQTKAGYGAMRVSYPLSGSTCNVMSHPRVKT